MLGDSCLTFGQSDCEKIQFGICRPDRNDTYHCVCDEGYKKENSSTCIPKGRCPVYLFIYLITINGKDLLICTVPLFKSSEMGRVKQKLPSNMYKMADSDFLAHTHSLTSAFDFHSCILLCPYWYFYRTTNALIRLRGCAGGWTGLLLSAYARKHVFAWRIQNIRVLE